MLGSFLSALRRAGKYGRFKILAIDFFKFDLAFATQVIERGAEVFFGLCHGVEESFGIEGGGTGGQRGSTDEVIAGGDGEVVDSGVFNDQLLDDGIGTLPRSRVNDLHTSGAGEFVGRLLLGAAIKHDNHALPAGILMAFEKADELLSCGDGGAAVELR